MKTNVTRFKKDLERLKHEGELLQWAMKKEVGGAEFVASMRKHFGKEDAEAIISNLPSFNTAYERWYSESLALLRQLLPDRVGNFVSLYEKPSSMDRHSGESRVQMRHVGNP